MWALQWTDDVSWVYSRSLHAGHFEKLATNVSQTYPQKLIEERESNILHTLYLYELLVRLVNLAENAGSVFHKVFDCIHVVERHKEDVFWSGAKKHLVLESHGHQVVEL